jgi:acetoacetyl-CoA synthetase
MPQSMEMGAAAGEAEVLWEPTEEQRRASNLARYLDWLRRTRGLHFRNYQELWRWSVTDLERFWASVWDYFEVGPRGAYERVLADPRMPGARWFQGAHLNYAARALQRRDGHPALLFRSEATGPDEVTTVTYAELADQVAAVRAGLRRLGVARGDRVVAYLPNVPEAVIGFLAAASLGATWSSCSPDFGTRAVVDRFQQIEPKVLLAVGGYRYNGRDLDRTPELADIRRSLPTLAATVVVRSWNVAQALERLPDAVSWAELAGQAGPLEFDPVPFDHPLWVLYSSGTTGLPKGIVHGHGGIVLEHLKALTLHQDLRPDDRFFWFTTTGWMMWNYLVGVLLIGGTAVLFDGSPGHPDLGTLWRLAQDSRITYFGTSAPYLQACLKAGVEPGRRFDLGSLRGLGSTGAPLSPEGFRWVVGHVRRGMPVQSVSGGTDCCAAFVQSCPLLPIRSGELQCAALGAKLEAFDEAGRPLVDEVGELVITAPMPSMPLYLWNDPDGSRYRDSYFAMYRGVWRHGDWIRITERGSAVIYGRSDSTLNRGGVRMGTSEFYRVVEELPEVSDSLVIDLSGLGEDGRLLLFVVLAPGAALDDGLRRRIAGRLREELSPRHVPDEIQAIAEVPRTLNGKKLEVPVKRLLRGTPLEQAVSPGAVANAAALEAFTGGAASVGSGAGSAGRGGAGGSGDATGPSQGDRA